MAYNSAHKFDIICLLKTCLNSETMNDENLNIPGKNLIKADHLSNTKREENCIYRHIMLVASMDISVS